MEGAQWCFGAESVGMGVLTSVSFTVTHWPHNGNWDDILDVHVRPCAGVIGDPFILMDDNARPHAAHAIQEYLEREGIERLDWPARSTRLE